MKTKYFLVIFLVSIIVAMSGCDKKNENQSTVSVFGTGTVSAQPDVIQMYITLSNVAETTKTAQEAVNLMVRQALTVLKEAGIEDKNIVTASLTFNPEYEYINGRVLVGQKASQGISFSIDNIITDNERVSRIIDQLIEINGIELNQINFNIKNNTEHFIRSRELAFEKAVEKATQYAELSKLKIKKVLRVSEEVYQQTSPVNQLLEAQAASDSAGSTIVPTGELEITTKILVVFLLK